MEGKTHFERVVGGDEESRALAHKDLQEFFDFKTKRFEGYEVEKTPEDIEIINKVMALVDRTVLRYGGIPKPLPLDHIHILRPDSIYAVSEGMFRGGMHTTLFGYIAVDKKILKLGFASTLIHELFHAKSYKSAQIKNGELDLYRSGFNMVDRKGNSEKKYFRDLEEAIVAECVKRSLDELRENSIFRDEVAGFEKFKNWVAAYARRKGISEEKIKEMGEEIKYIDGIQEKITDVTDYSEDEKHRQAYAAGTFDAIHKQGKDIEWVERYKERKKMYDLFDNLIEKSGGKFKSRDEVFEIFATANFSGNYLTVAKVVEDILGKGAFRKLAEEFSLTPQREGQEIMDELSNE